MQAGGPLTYSEMSKLAESIKKLQTEYLAGLVDIVAKASPESINGNEVVVDLQTLPNSALIEMKQYCQEKLGGDGGVNGLDESSAADIAL